MCASHGLCVDSIDVETYQRGMDCFNSFGNKDIG